MFKNILFVKYVQKKFRVIKKTVNFAVAKAQLGV